MVYPIALAAMAVAFVVRSAYVLAQDRFGIFDVKFVAGDALFYVDLAESIAAGQGMAVDGTPTAYVGPVYPVFLAMLFSLGLDPLAIGLVQAVLGALTAALAALLALEFARSTGMHARWHPMVVGLSGIGAALYPHLVFWTGYLLTETLFLFLVGLSLYSFVRAATAGNGAWSLAGGLASGLAALTRPPYLAVALVIFAWALVAARGKRLLPIVPVVFALGLAMPISVWTVRNVLDLGAPVVTSTESGAVFYQGNSKGATGGTDGYVSTSDYLPLALPPELNEVERDSAYFRQALHDIAADPFETVARWPRKVINMWRPTYATASLRNWFVTLATYPAVLILGMGGAILLLRAGLLRVTAVPILFLATWFVIHVVVTGMIRFRVPAELVLVVTAPFALAALADRAALARSAR